MPDRILDFSEEAALLSVRLANLVIRRPDKPAVTLPLSDIAAVVLSNPQITCSLAVLAGLAAQGASVVVCDDNRLPVGMMIPLQAHFTQSERIEMQTSATLPMRKRLWRQIVQAKIIAQATALELETGSDGGLTAMSRRVRSGDPDNIEAQAARRYWPLIFGESAFQRDREAEGLNAVLNYGYTVLRALTGRAVCAVGLHPSVGLHHHNRYSQFTLADDLMEPFRTIVDRTAIVVRGNFGSNPALTRDVKAELIGALQSRYLHDGEQRTLFDIVSRACSSLVGVFEGTAGRLDLPDFRSFFPDAEDAS